MPDITIIERMQRAPLVFDGAMGTMLYGKGIFINRCFDELCLTDPAIVSDVHRQYIAAGADVIETNTFGANRIWLSGFGLADQAVEINKAGARLAREAAGSNVYVAGSVGPCLKPGQVLEEEHRDRAREAFAECIGALADGGVDCIILETFSDVEEIRLAIEAAAQHDRPVIASIAVDATGETIQGVNIRDIIPTLDADDRVDAIGLNCGSGPADLHSAAEVAVRLTNKPIVVLPNAGQPKQIEGRTLYLVNPEYYTEYATKLVKLGVRAIGGCCGTTPEHIRLAAKSVHALTGEKKRIEIQSHTTKAERVDAIALAGKSRFGARIARGEKVSSVEIVPPRSSDLSRMLERARTCHLAGVDAINIPDGPRASARISPMVAAIAIRREIGIEPILHYCCRDRNLIGMQSDLLGGYAAGVHNFLIITGDPPKLGDYPDATGVFDIDAIGLVRMTDNLNHGLDIGGNPIRPPVGICIGVGVDPSAVEREREIDRFRRKIDAGAEYAITQPIFDAEVLLRFLDDIANLPRTIPIVAGIWPLVSFKNAEFMNNEVPGVEVPAGVLERMSTCQTKEDGWRMGVEISRDIRERIAPAVAGFQVSAPFGKVELAIDVLR